MGRQRKTRNGYVQANYSVPPDKADYFKALAARARNGESLPDCAVSSTMAQDDVGSALARQVAGLARVEAGLRRLEAAIMAAVKPRRRDRQHDGPVQSSLFDDPVTMPRHNHGTEGGVE